MVGLRRTVLVVTLSGVGLLAGRAGAQCQQDWIGGEQFPGANGAVGASIMWDPDGPGPRSEEMVVAGDFSVIGAAVASRIATFDGTTWTNPFGAGLDGMVHALAIFNGELIAAGEFANAGGAPASHVARWTGASWQPMGAGVDGSVFALTVLNGQLVAGGAFSHAGGNSALNIAAWDGVAWAPVGAGGLDGPVYTLGTLGNDLYAGGEFDHADNAIAANIAKWNGTAWSDLAGGVSVAAQYAPAQVRALLNDGGYLYVGGRFDHVGAMTAYGVARWDGSAWSAAGQGLYHRTCIRYSCTNHPYRALALGRAGSLIYAAAAAPTSEGPLMFQFNGTSWSSAGALSATGMSDPPLSTIAGYNGQVYVGGSFGGTGSPLNLARLSAGAWGLATGMDGSVTSLTPFNAGLVATGDFTEIDGTPFADVALWDGAAWHALGAGVAAAARGAVVINGELYVSAWPGGILHWTGSAWETLYGAGGFGGAPAIGSWNGQVVTGIGGPGFGGDQSAVAVWNGTTWVPVGEVSWVASGRTPFATIGSTLYVAGYFGTSYVGRYNGGDWQAVGTNALGSAFSLLVHNSSLYAIMGDTPGGVVAVLNGNVWQQVGGAFDVIPDSIASVNGELYAGGTFTNVGGTPINGVARWDGSAWQPLGQGAEGGVLAIAGLNGNVVIGGTFDSAGGKGYARFAYYGCVPPPPCPCDFNADGTRNSQDFFDFLGAFFGSQASADYNRDGAVNSQDFFDFLGCFFDSANGC